MISFKNESASFAHRTRCGGQPIKKAARYPLHSRLTPVSRPQMCGKAANSGWELNVKSIPCLNALLWAQPHATCAHCTTKSNWQLKFIAPSHMLRMVGYFFTQGMITRGGAVLRGADCGQEHESRLVTRLFQRRLSSVRCRLNDTELA